jgi:hypothetical protein
VSHAQVITYRWATLTDTFATNFGNVNVGNSISLRLYVEQSGGNPLGSDGGMFAYAGRVRYDNPLGSTVPSTTATIANPGTPPSTFGPDFQPNIPPGGAATINGQTAYSNVFNISSSFSSGAFPDANGRILLGTVRFTALTPGVFSFRAEDPHPTAGGDFTTFNNLNNLDGFLVSGTAQFTVTAVPEPSTLVLVGLAAGVWRLRRRISLRSAPTRI